MSRRRIGIFVAITFGAVAAATSCGHGSELSEESATDGAALPGRPGFGAAGADMPAPAPLAPPAPPGAPEGGADMTRDTGTPSGAVLGKVAAARAFRGTSPQGVSSQAVAPGSMLIRAGQAVVEVDSVQVGIARVRRLAQETGALVANTTIHAGREQQRSASLELRVPSDRFDAVVNGLAPIGKVESVNISAQDVGEEFVDLTARVANARRLEARLIQLLAERTGRLADVLSVERELARVREEIERYEGRLRYLQARVSVSSLTVTVHEPPPVVAAHPGENVIAEAFVEAWRRFVLLVAAFIASLGVLVPVAALAAGGFLLWRRYAGSRTAAAERA